MSTEQWVKKTIAMIVANISFFGLWYIGSVADTATGHAPDSNAEFTPMIIFAAVALLASSFYLGKSSK